MDKMKEIESGFKELGFKKNDDSFVFEHISYNTMNVNGHVMKQEVKTTIEFKYTGTGGNVDDSDDCVEDMLFFDVFENGELGETIGVYCFDDIKKMIGVK